MTTDAELDRMYEAAIADEWEEINRTPERKYPEWTDAIKKLEAARALLSEAAEMLTAGAELVEGSFEDDRILSLQSETEHLANDYARQVERMKSA